MEQVLLHNEGTSSAEPLNEQPASTSRDIDSDAKLADAHAQLPLLANARVCELLALL